MSETNNNNITLELDDVLISALKNSENTIKFKAYSSNISTMNYIWEEDTKILRLSLTLNSLSSDSIIIIAYTDSEDCGKLTLKYENYVNNIEDSIDSNFCVGKNIIEIDLTELDINAKIESDLSQYYVINESTRVISQIINDDGYEQFYLGDDRYTKLDDKYVAKYIYKIDNKGDVTLDNNKTYNIKKDAKVVESDKIETTVEENYFELNNSRYIIDKQNIIDITSSDVEIKDNKFTLYSDNSEYLINKEENIISNDINLTTVSETSSRREYRFFLTGVEYTLILVPSNSYVRNTETREKYEIDRFTKIFLIGNNTYTYNLSSKKITSYIPIIDNRFTIADKDSYIINENYIYNVGNIILINYTSFKIGNTNYQLVNRDIAVYTDAVSGKKEYNRIINSNLTISINNDNQSISKYYYIYDWENLIISDYHKLENNRFTVSGIYYFIQDNSDQEASIKFLEGIGVYDGTSIFLADRDDEEKPITKESFLKLLYKTVSKTNTSEVGEIKSYINSKNGQQVYRNTKFRVYNPKEFDIYLSGKDLVTLKNNTYGLKIQGGSFEINGTIGYTDYIIINNICEKTETGKINASDLLGYQLEFPTNTKIFKDIDDVISSNTIYYNESENKSEFITENLTIFFECPGINEELVKCEKSFNLIQAVNYDIPWELVLPGVSENIWAGDNYCEKEITRLNTVKEIPTIVFNNIDNTNTSIKIKTTDPNIAIALENKQFSVSYTHSPDYPSDLDPEVEFTKYFKINIDNISISHSNAAELDIYTAEIPITYINSDVPDKYWAPCGNDTQELIKATIKLDESLDLGNYSSSFYLAGRSKNIQIPKIYENLGDDIKNYTTATPITELKLTYLQSHSIRLLYNRPEEEHYWVSMKNISSVSINNNNYSSENNKYETSGLSKIINITVRGKIETDNILVFSDLSKELWDEYGSSKTINISDWKINILLPSASLILKTKKQIITFWYDLDGTQRKIINDDGNITKSEINDHNRITVNQNNIYKLYLSSNLETKLTLSDNSLVHFAKAEGADLISFHKELNFNAIEMSEGINVEFELREDVKRLKSNAFSNCHDLIEIIIPNTIEVIEDSAFENCINLKKVTLPTTLREIGKRAFYSCKNLSEVVITEDNIEYIAPEAFDNTELINGDEIIIGQTLLKYSTNITTADITVGNGRTIKTIASGAFSGCKNINKITIPSSVKFIGDNVFNGCGELKEIIFDSIEEGKYNIPLVVGHKYEGNTRKSLLENCPIETVSLGRNIKYRTETEEYKSVGDSLYSKIDWWEYNSTKGKGYPNNGGQEYNDDYENQDLGYTLLFKDKNSLKTITFNNGVEVIRDLEFFGCSLDGCEVKFSDTIKEIGFKSFYSTGIKSIEISKDSKLEYIWTKAFMNCISLTKVTIESENLKKLGRLVFCGTTNLVVGSDWNSDKKENADDFKHLFANFKITLSKLDEVGNGLLFESGIYTSWKTYNNGSNTKKYSRAFILIDKDKNTDPGWLIDLHIMKDIYYYSMIDKVTGPNHTCFYNKFVGTCNDLCWNFQTNWLIEFPDTLKYIGARAFKKSLWTSSTVYFRGNTNKVLFREDAFVGTSIAYTSFDTIARTPKAGGEKYDKFDLTAWCNNYTFENKYANPLCGTTYLRSGDNKYVYGNNIHVGNEGSPVNIPDYAFYGWTENGGEYSIQGYVKKVGKQAFDQATDPSGGNKSVGLQFVKLFGVEEIGDYAFRNRSELAEVQIIDSPNLKSIGKDAFTGTKWFNGQNCIKSDGSENTIGIYYLPIKNGDNIIENYYAYNRKGSGDFFEILGEGFNKENTIGFSNLSNITGSDNITVGYSSDSSFILNNKIKYIGNYAFSENNQIETINLSNNTIKYIGDYAFYNCTNLSKITLSNKISYIGLNSFVGTGISELRIYSNVDEKIEINKPFSKNNNFSQLILPKLSYWCNKVDLNEVESNPIKYLYNGKLYFSDEISVRDMDAVGEELTIDFSFESDFNGTIGKYVLSYLPRVKEIKIGGDKITKIDDYAFYNCPELTKVSLSNSVNTIGKFAFYKEYEETKNILIVEFKSQTAPEISNNSFNPKNTLFIIPEDGQGYDQGEYELFIKVTSINNIINGEYFNQDIDDKVTIYNSNTFKDTIEKIKVDFDEVDKDSNEITSVSANNIAYIAIKDLDTETTINNDLDIITAKTINSADGEEIEITIPVYYKNDSTGRRAFEFGEKPRKIIVDNSNIALNLPVEHLSHVIPTFEIEKDLLISLPNNIKNITSFSTKQLGDNLFEPEYSCNKLVEQLSNGQTGDLIATIYENPSSKYPIEMGDEICNIKLSNPVSEVPLYYYVYQDAAKQPGIYIKDRVLNPENNVILYYSNSKIEIPLDSYYDIESGGSKLDEKKLIEDSLTDTQKDYTFTQEINCGDIFTDGEKYKTSELSLSLRKWENDSKIKVSGVLGKIGDSDSLGEIELSGVGELNATLEKLYTQNIKEISIKEGIKGNNDSITESENDISNYSYKLIIPEVGDDTTVLENGIEIIDNKYRSIFDLNVIIPGDQSINNSIEKGFLLDEASDELNSVNSEISTEKSYIMSIIDDSETKHKFLLNSSNEPMATLVGIGFNTETIQTTEPEEITEDTTTSQPETYVYVEKPKDDLLTLELETKHNTTSIDLMMLHSAKISDIINYSESNIIEQTGNYTLNIRSVDSDGNLENFSGSSVIIEDEGRGKYKNGKCEFLYTDDNGEKQNATGNNVRLEFTENILNTPRDINFVVNKSKDEIIKEKYLTSPIVAEYTITTTKNEINTINFFNLEKLSSVYKVTVEGTGDNITVHTTTFYPPIYSFSTPYDPVGKKVITFTVCIYLKDLSSFDSSEFFKDITELNNVVLPYGIKSIGKGMFSGCTSLDIVSIPYSVESIEESAFSGSSIVTVAIPDSVTKIDKNAFHGCKKLVHLVIPNSVESLGQYVFKGCTNLWDIMIGNGIKKIYNDIFSDTEKLKVIHFTGDLPKIITSSGTKTTKFSDYNSLSILYCTNNNSNLDCYKGYNCSNELTILTDRNNKDKKETIGLSSDFYNKVTTLTIRNPYYEGLTDRYYNEKFGGYHITVDVCNNKSGFDYVSFDWNLNEKLVDIDSYGNWYSTTGRFEKNSLSIKINIDRSVREFITLYFHSKDTDKNGNTITDIPIYSLSFWSLDDTQGPNYWSYTKHDGCGYINFAPAITTIGVKALDTCGIKSFLFPRGLKNLNTAACYNNKYLKSVIFYPNKNLEYFGTSISNRTDQVRIQDYECVFAKCSNLLSIEIPGFYSEIYESIIPNRAFDACSNLRYVGFLDDSCTYQFGYAAFRNCKKLCSDIVLHSAIIYQYFIEGCPYVKNLVFLGDNSKVEFKTSETNVYYYFKECENLNHIYIEAPKNNLKFYNKSGVEINASSVNVNAYNKSRLMSSMIIHTKEEYRTGYLDAGFKNIGKNTERRVVSNQDILKIKITQKGVPHSSLKIGDIEVNPRLTDESSSTITRCLGIHSSGYVLNPNPNNNYSDWNIVTINIENVIDGGSIFGDGKLYLECETIDGTNTSAPGISSIESEIVGSTTEDDTTTYKVRIKVNESYQNYNNLENNYLLLHNKDSEGNIKETWPLGYVRGWTKLQVGNNYTTTDSNTVLIGSESSPIELEKTANKYTYSPSVDVLQCEPVYNGTWTLSDERVINSCFSDDETDDEDTNTYCYMTIGNGRFDNSEGIISSYTISSSFAATIDNSYPKLNISLSTGENSLSPSKITYQNITINQWRIDPEENSPITDNTSEIETYELTEVYSTTNYITPTFNIELWLKDKNYNNTAANNGEESLE